MPTLKKGTKVTIKRNSRLIHAVVAKTTKRNEEFPFVLVHTEHDTALLVRWDEIIR